MEDDDDDPEPCVLREGTSVITSERFYDAIRNERLSEALGLLRNHRDEIDVHYTSNEVMGRTPLHLISELGRLKENAPAFVQLLTQLATQLLSDPRTDVNKPTIYGSPPIYYACETNSLDIVRLLLEHPKVDVNILRNGGESSLWCAASLGHNLVVKWMLALRPEIDTQCVPHGAVYMNTPRELAYKAKNTELVELFDRYHADPEGTRFALRLELGLALSMGAGVFATCVFLCDDYLRIRVGEAGSPAARFYAIMRRLPLELQMVLANRLYGSERETVSPDLREAAFRRLAGLFLW